MRSLFWKIFLSFWAAQATTIALTVLLATLSFQREEPRIEQAREDLHGYAQKAVAAWESGGAEALQEQLTQLSEATGFRLWLFDGTQRELSGNPAPEWITRRLTGQSVDRNPRPSRARLPRMLTAQAEGERGHYILAAELPFRGIGRPPLRVIFRQLAIGLLVSGIICFLLAHSLTRPIIRLRHAAQTMAKGNLSARASARDAKRKDEIGDLVRDFDGMAGRLEDLLGSQKRLLRDISHDLRSPLQRLRIALGLARRKDETLAGQLDRIDREAVRIDSLIDQLLTLTWLESGDARPEMKPAPLNAIIAEVVADANFEAARRDCKVAITAQAAATVNGDEELLRRAIENTVLNAVHYSPSGSAIEIELRVDSGVAVIGIRDHGPGVPEAALPHLFRPFYRVDESRASKTGGAGLGLAISARAIEAHGGSIAARNVEPQGLCIEIRLPALAAEAVAVNK